MPSEELHTDDVNLSKICAVSWIEQQGYKFFLHCVLSYVLFVMFFGVTNDTRIKEQWHFLHVLYKIFKIVHAGRYTDWK